MCSNDLAKLGRSVTKSAKKVAKTVVNVHKKAVDEMVVKPIKKGTKETMNAIGDATGANAARDAANQAARDGKKAAKEGQDAFTKVINDQTKAAEKLYNKEAADAARLEQEAKQKEADEISAQERKQARGRQKAIALGAEGRRDTILTGPLGLTSPGSGRGRKTLLGE